MYKIKIKTKILLNPQVQTVVSYFNYLSKKSLGYSFNFLVCCVAVVDSLKRCAAQYRRRNECTAQHTRVYTTHIGPGYLYTSHAPIHHTHRSTTRLRIVFTVSASPSPCISSTSMPLTHSIKCSRSYTRYAI